jgi:hypothetical protein
MTTAKKLGVFMDHESAHLMEFTYNPIETKTLLSKFTYEVKEASLKKGEYIMHNREQHQQSEYYKELGEIIKKYGEVILFGPTKAKFELFNVLHANQDFSKIRIMVKDADKMTENQQHAFVREYFSKN